MRGLISFNCTCEQRVYTYSGSTGACGVASAAAAMSAFIPVLLWLVQCSHECAEAVVNSVIAVARMISFMLPGGRLYLARMAMCKGGHWGYVNMLLEV